jgi:indole-3-glycerol phosphate synthase
MVDDFPYLDIAQEYEASGADALSVLTEPDYFQGCNRHLIEIRESVKIPLLRKDFIIDRFQIEQSACLGADAILLICAILPQAKLAEYIAEADRLGLTCLVEAHSEEEVKEALLAGARVIGVNNRDLNSFEVDMNNSIRLKKLVPQDLVFVSESGIKSAFEVDLLRQRGVDAVLVGEALMRATDKKAELNRLRGQAL